MGQGLKLLIIILFPMVISLAVSMLFCSRGNGFKTRLKSILVLDPCLGLIKQGLLWMSILLPICYFFAFGLIAWEGHHLEISANGLKNFVEYSVVPIAILACSLPLAVLVSRFHATEQTARQISVTVQKNNFDAFYSHRKELFSYFEMLDEVDYLGCLKASYKIHPRVHKNYFLGKPENGVPIINVDVFKDVGNRLEYCKTLMNSVITGDKNERSISLYANLCYEIHILSLRLGLTDICQDLLGKGIDLPIKNNKVIRTIGVTTDEVVASYRYIRNFFVNLCDFSGYETDLKFDDIFPYLDLGSEYRTIHPYLVIEGIHEIMNLNKIPI